MHFPYFLLSIYNVHNILEQLTVTACPLVFTFGSALPCSKYILVRKINVYTLTYLDIKLVPHKKVCTHVRDNARLDKIRNLGKESKIHF